MKILHSILYGVVFGIAVVATLPIAAFKWWQANPPPEPRYSASVRVRPSYALQSVLWLLLAVFVLANGLKLAGVII